MWCVGHNKLKLAIFEREILRKIYRPKINNEREYEIRSNQEIKDMYGEATINGVLKSSKLSWAGYVHVEIRENNWKSYRMETKHKKTKRTSQTKMKG